MKSSKESAMAGAANNALAISHLNFTLKKLEFTLVQMDNHRSNEGENNAVLHKQAQAQCLVSIGRVVFAFECHC